MKSWVMCCFYLSEYFLVLMFCLYDFADLYFNYISSWKPFSTELFWAQVQNNQLQCNKLNRGRPTLFVAPFSKYLVAFSLMKNKLFTVSPSFVIELVLWLAEKGWVAPVEFVTL